MSKKLCVIFLFCSVKLLAQNDPIARNAFMHQSVQDAFDYWNIARPSTKFHSTFRPYLISTYKEATDSVVPFSFFAFRNFFLSKTVNEKPQARNWFNLQAHPILDFEPAADMLSKKPMASVAAGSHFKVNINNDFTMAATLVGGKMTPPFFLDTTIQIRKILPEFGQAYGSTKKGYAFFDYTGYVSYSPNQNKFFNFQLGRDKHFIGDGYRSVLLSDFAPAYPYFRINTNVWRLQYNVWYTWFNDVGNANGIKKNFTNKYGTFHYLSYNILKELNVAFFENVIWRGTDTTQVRVFDANYLNPVIFYRPIEYSLGSPDNSFMGLNINATLFKRIKLYAQLGLDEFYLKEIKARRGWWANKQAWQLGAKYINAFGIKGLKLQAEYNQVRPFTYTHGLASQNYGHYGFPLAHPAGANFIELLSFINYRKNNWELSWRGSNLIIGKDSVGKKSNVGQNIFLSYVTRTSEYGHKTTQGIKTIILQSDLRFTFYIIPNMNMRLEFGYIQRSERNSLNYKLQNPYVYLAFKTSFWNSYRDY